MKTTHTFIGEYIYSSNIDLAPVSFTLSYSSTFLGRISGSVQDGPSGMPELGKIIGFKLFRNIHFKKLMPIARIYVDNKSQTFSEYATFLGYSSITNPPHPPIFYNGVFSKDFSNINGTWYIEEQIFRLDKNHGIKTIPMNGYWNAKVAE